MMPEHTRRATALTNATLAEQFERIAELLEVQEANPFRVRAYRQVAATLRQLDRPVAAILDAEGVAGLIALPTIGTRLGAAIADVLHNRPMRSMIGSQVPQIGSEGVLWKASSTSTEASCGYRNQDTRARRLD